MILIGLDEIWKDGYPWCHQYENNLFEMGTHLHPTYYYNAYWNILLNETIRI